MTSWIEITTWIDLLLKDEKYQEDYKTLEEMKENIISYKNVTEHQLIVLNKIFKKHIETKE